MLELFALLLSFAEKMPQKYPLLFACLICFPHLQVKLVSARGLFLEGVFERLHGLQARLLLPNRRPVLSGVVQLGRARDQEVVWEHEEQFTEVSLDHTFEAARCWLVPRMYTGAAATLSAVSDAGGVSLLALQMLDRHRLRAEGYVDLMRERGGTVSSGALLLLYVQVTALSDLIIEVWGLPYGRMFAQGSYRAPAASGSNGKHDAGPAGGNGRHGDGGPAGGTDGGGGHGELPSNSIFLGAVTVSSNAGTVAVSAAVHACCYPG